ncbi:MAG TPA: 50S ribosomal protein L25 [Candidatus Saccharimonadales bacterium]
MEDVTVTYKKRDVTGKAVKRLRTAGHVPAVIHDHGKESQVVQIEYAHMVKTFHAAGKHHPVHLDGDHKYTALIKHVTFDPKRNTITHVVFNAVKANEKVETTVPVHPQYAEGNDISPAERASLIVLHNTESVEVEALPKDLPDELFFDGEKLVAVGDHATVADLTIPQGVVVKTDPTTVLSTVFEPSALQAANDAAGGDAEADEATKEETAEGEAETGKAEGEKKE